MSYSEIPDHRAMIFDQIRNQAYLKGIQETVKPGDIVLDLGAGLGVLGLLALQQGAGKVYMVEPADSVLEVARLVAKHNNLDDRLVVVPKTIEEANIPEQVDCILSVFTGNFMLSEDLLPSLIYARGKYLKPNGVMLPSRGIMQLAPVVAQEFYSNSIDGWASILDLEYSLVRSYAVNSTYDVAPTNFDCTLLAEPTSIFELDFVRAENADCRSTNQVNICKSGTCHGLLGWFNAQVGSDWISTSPVGEQMHWSQVFLPLDKPINVEPGDVIQVDLNRPENGNWTWSVKHNKETQRQSTFLGRPQNPEKLSRRMDTYMPKLNKQGEALRQILDLFDGTHKSLDIARKIQSQYPDFQSSERSTLDTIKYLIDSYASDDLM
ncbi:MAG TPA: methyltransferase domain-containing protein [Dehalococcoidia bacterium]|nr:methyltransferase domain-containing protein [Dehalococcoidia bacterium]